MHRWARPLAAALVAVVLGSAAVGCADDDDAAQEAERAAEGSASTSSSTSTSIQFTGDADSPFCSRLRDVRLEGLLDGEVATPAEVEAAFVAVLGALQELADVAPPELVEDTSLVLAGMVALDDALRAVGYSYDALAAEPEVAVQVSRAANDPAFADANARIEAYKDQVCHL